MFIIVVSKYITKKETHFSFQKPVPDANVPETKLLRL